MFVFQAAVIAAMPLCNQRYSCNDWEGPFGISNNAYKIMMNIFMPG